MEDKLKKEFYACRKDKPKKENIHTFAGSLEKADKEACEKLEKELKIAFKQYTDFETVEINGHFYTIPKTKGYIKVPDDTEVTDKITIE